MKDEPGVIIELHHSSESAREIYDLFAESRGASIDDAHEVTYGKNTYISDEKQDENGDVYFYYVGNTKPVVSLFTEITDGNRAAIEEILSTFNVE